MLRFWIASAQHRAAKPKDDLFEPYGKARCLDYLESVTHQPKTVPRIGIFRGIGRCREKAESFFCFKTIQNMAKTAKAKGATTTNSSNTTQKKPGESSAKGKAKASEIDDIFAGGSSSSNKTEAAITGDTTITNKKSKKQKRKREDGADIGATPKDPSDPAAKTAPAKPPVTVVDTSKETEKAVRQAAQPAAGKKRKQTDKSAKEKAEEEDEMFKDSRGTSSSMFCTTCAQKQLADAGVQDARQTMASAFIARTSSAYQKQEETLLYVPSTANAASSGAS
jgi:hypothetical protein